MKKFYSLCVCIFVLLSCSKNEPTTETEEEETNSETGSETETPTALKACFTLTKTDFEVGESLQITNCSEGDITSYHYDFGNDNISLKENPEVLLEEKGNFNILLTIADSDNKTETFSKSISVSLPVFANYIFPDIPSEFSAYPLETGLTPNNKIYYLELTEDLENMGIAKFNYREMEANYTLTSQYIMDKQFNTKSAFINFLSNGNRNLHFSRTLPDFYGSHEITFNSSWVFLNALNSASKHNYGFIPDNDNFLYYGSQEENDIRKTVIERRNANGDAFEIYLNEFGNADAMIGDLIAKDNGFAAFGSVFTINTTAPQITAYKPLLIFFDTDLNVTSHVIFENSALSSKITSMNDLNGAYHIEELTNGNFAMYANGELIIADASGTEINTVYFEDTENNQALISLGDSFIISTNDYLRKFDMNGNQTAALKYNGSHMPEIIQKDGQLFFVAGYDIMEDNISLTKLFYGAIDTNLNLINLN